MRQDEEAAEKKRMDAAFMRTPLQELHRRERAEKKARGKPILSEETLARIGEVMASKNAPGTIEEAVSS